MNDIDGIIERFTYIFEYHNSLNVFYEFNQWGYGVMKISTIVYYSWNFINTLSYLSKVRKVWILFNELHAHLTLMIALIKGIANGLGAQRCWSSGRGLPRTLEDSWRDTLPMRLLGLGMRWERQLKAGAPMIAWFPRCLAYPSS